MSVVINEFEIIAEPPTDQPTQGAPQEMPSGEKPAVRVTDIINIYERQQQRLLRLFAD